MKKSNLFGTIVVASSLLLQLGLLCFQSHGAAGDVDLSFDPGSGVNGQVSAVVTQLDGKVLIGGDFTSVNGTNRNRIARLNTNGSLDSSFNPGTGTNGGVRSIKLQPDGKMIIGGGFNTVNGTNRISLARLNAGGSLDGSFNPDLPFGVVTSEYDSASTAAVAVQLDGKMLVAGVAVHFYGCEFEGCAGVITVNFLTRLNTDGSRDTNFNTYSPGPGAYQTVLAIGLQSDGKVLVGEYFGVVRLNPNGSLDGSFNSGTGPNYWVNSVIPLPDGKVLLGGGFTAVNGTNRNGIARLNANGSLDNSFNPGAGVTGEEAAVYSVAVQSDGKSLIGGYFSAVNGTSRTNIARLKTDGSLDSSFNPGTGVDQVVRSIALQPDGNLLIGGGFTTVNGVVRPHVARLYGDPAAPSLSIVRSNAFMIVSWPASSTGFVLQQNTNLNSSNWTTPSETVTDNGTTKSITVSPTPGNRYFRLSKP